MKPLIELFRTHRHAPLVLLLACTAIGLTLGLGQRELWGAETRWANIALQMLQSGDYFDPYLKGSAYYDKPLPSYWLITATAWLLGVLDHWSLRLPSVIAAWLSVWLVYALGERLFAKGTGLLAGWLLTTTFYFLFWSRLATADILTVFGILAAVWWYWRGPEDTRWSRYAVFFVILALTSLLKGLIGFVLPALVLLPHLLNEGHWKRHLNGRLVLALGVSGAVYAVPFALSHLYGRPTYEQSGLGLVFRENVVRFFQPFDNFGPIYTYLIYLPVYTLPWAPCWLMGLWLALKTWKQAEPNLRWLVWALVLLFVFFSACGSRRSYYVLPLVPFAQLLGAWWLNQHLTARRAAGRPQERLWQCGIGIAGLVLLIVLGVIYPRSNSTVPEFAARLRTEASALAPWSRWQMVMVEVDNKLPMYLQQPEGSVFYYVPEGEDFPREGSPAQFWAWLERHSGKTWDPAHTIVIAQYTDPAHPPLDDLADGHQVLLSDQKGLAKRFHHDQGGSVAYLPLPQKSAVSAEPERLLTK